MQHILAHGQPSDRINIVNQLRGKLPVLSQHKYARYRRSERERGREREGEREGERGREREREREEEGDGQFVC